MSDVGRGHLAAKSPTFRELSVSGADEQQVCLYDELVWSLVDDDVMFSPVFSSF